MKVILKENVQSLGKTGQVVKVSDGYGRNFLIPKGLAVEATDKNISVLNQEKKSREKKAERQRGQAEQVQAQLQGMECIIYRKEGDQGKLFGAVTAKDIEKALSEQGVAIDRKNIIVAEPIKNVGSYPVKIKIYSGMTAEIMVSVRGDA
jgi:large subunit ribosomal protein L9